MRASASPLAAIATCLTLAVPLAVISDPGAAANAANAAQTYTSGTRVAGTGVAVATATPSPSTATPDVVPCPRTKPKLVSPLPKPSPLPTHDLSRPTLGGERLATAGLVVPAGVPAVPTSLTAKSWIVADLDSGAVLGACGPHAYGAPASVQKLLLAVTVLPKLDPAQVVTVTAEDMNYEPGSSAVGLIKGGKYNVETLWLGLFLNSGNDAANVLARLGGGADGVAGTMADMNAEAHRLGAWDTHAETPSGLDGPGQVTSAYDLALIARALFDRDDFLSYAAARTAKIPAQPHKNKPGFQIQNDNRLMYEYPGALGGKTGFTDIARHTYVGAAQRDGRRLVVALLGAERRPTQGWEQGAALLDWGFSLPRDASVGRLIAPGEAEAVMAAAAASAEAGLPPAAAGADAANPAVLIGVGSVGGAFVVVWLAVLIFTRRRRTPAQAATHAGDTTAAGGRGTVALP